jgi:hypothetical protein
VDDLGDMSSLTELSEFSDDELVPYTMKMPRPILAVKGSLQRRKKKRRSPYSLIVTLKYMECERPDRKEVPVSEPFTAENDHITDLI